MLIEPDVSKAQQIRPSISAVILNERHEVLLQRRSDNGQWGLPGGSVEIGESVTDVGRPIRPQRKGPTGGWVEWGRMGLPTDRIRACATRLQTCILERHKPASRSDR